MKINLYKTKPGFGQSGPYKDMAGHDINYLAVSGVLSTLGRKHENPIAPSKLCTVFLEWVFKHLEN